MTFLAIATVTAGVLGTDYAICNADMGVLITVLKRIEKKSRRGHVPYEGPDLLLRQSTARFSKDPLCNNSDVLIGRFLAAEKMQDEISNMLVYVAKSRPQFTSCCSSRKTPANVATLQFLSCESSATELQVQGNRSSGFWALFARKWLTWACQRFLDTPHVLMMVRSCKVMKMIPMLWCPDTNYKWVHFTKTV